MRAIEIDHPGEDFAGLVEVERERPTPGPDEVLLRMRACSPKHQDVSLVDPERGFGPSELVDFPVTPVSDGAGEVVEVGADVERLSVGDRVATRYAPNWVEGPGSAEEFDPFAGLQEDDGVLAEYVTLRAAGLPVLPEHLSFAEGATLPSDGLAAWHALVENGGIGADETALVMGTGGVSTFALQFAAMHGARTVVTSSSDGKLETAEELGAWRTINYEETPDWGEVVVDWTDGGVDHVLELGGVGTMPQALTAAAINGHVHVVGVADKAGPRDYDIHDNIHRPIFHKALRVEGIWGAGSRAMFDRMNAALEKTGTRPVVDSTYDLADVRSAYRRLHGQEHQGRVVVTIP